MTEPRKHKIVRILRYGNPAWGAKTALGIFTALLIWRILP